MSPSAGVSPSAGANATATGGFGAVTGRVFGIFPGNGESPVPGALLRVFLPHTDQVIAETVTDQEGFFFLEEVPGTVGPIIPYLSVSSGESGSVP